MEVVFSENRFRWNEIVCKFEAADIYYKNEYVQSMLKGSKDKGVLFFYSDNEFSVCYPMIIKDIAHSEQFEGLLPENTYFDMEVPYGYGGPLCVGHNEKSEKQFIKELTKWCIDQNVVSQFIRFHPVLDNQSYCENIGVEKKYIHHTIAMHTTNAEDILKNMDSKKRNMVRKAEKNGVIIEIDENLDGIDDFKRIYTTTMDQHNADDMYYFTDEYYAFLKSDFLDHTVLFKAVYEGKIIAASLFFFDDNNIHYHLSGKDAEYRNLAPTDLLLYTAACWASKRGIKKFHLGGGLSENDSLYDFKKGFNKNATLDFYIGRTIFLQEKYDELLSVRERADASFEINNNRMIQYRA